MSNANSYELAMLDLINEEREAAGLEALRLITTLNDAAETHSSWMLDTDMFSHAGADGSSPSDRMEDAGYSFEGNSLALENIGWQSLRGAEGIDDDVSQVHASLMNSAGHRANILNPNAEDIGIGVETGTFDAQGGSYDAVMVTQVFGSTDADISAWVDPGTGDDVEEPPVVEEADDGQPVDDDPVEDDMVAEDDPVDETPVEDETMDDDPVEDEADDDMEDAPDDDASDDEEDMDDGTEDEDGDDLEIDDPEVVVDDDDSDDDPLNDDVESEEDDEDIVMDDDQPENDMPDDMPVCDLPSDGPPVLPFALSQFTVDLREAFEFTREGDQLVWETSEEKLIDVFLTAFEDWAMIPDEDMAADEADIADLMIDDAPEATIDMGCDDVQDEWLFDCSI